MATVAEPGAARATLTYAVVGKPNCGKTTIFNALTGMRQKVANYPGATVECKVGTAFGQHGEKITLVDVPGTHSLAVASPDEAVARRVMLGLTDRSPVPDRYLVVADASNLRHCLFLATQVAELGRPVVIALNMMDEARNRGMTVDATLIEERLGVTVVPMQANKGVGLLELCTALSRESLSSPHGSASMPGEVDTSVETLTPAFARTDGGVGDASGQALMWLTDADGEGGLEGVPAEIASQVVAERERLDGALPGWRSQAIASRHQYARELLSDAVHTGEIASRDLTRRLDAVALHPLGGWLVLLAVAFAVFYSVFSLASWPMDMIDAGFSGLGEWVSGVLPEGQLTSLLVDGVIAGVGGVVIFLPQILILIFFISLLESSGYLPRVAFMLDRLFSGFGLDGRSFIPLLSSYACAIPGIMGARAIRSPRERMATIMVAPWMSCTARLPVYLLMVAMLVPGDGPNAWLIKTLVLAGAYVIGTIGALIAALILRKSILKGAGGGFSIELPPYRLPRWRNVALEMLDRGLLFLKKAGTIILAISIVLWFLMSYPRAVEANGEPAPGSVQLRDSYAGMLGHTIEPVIKPLGFDWKIGIGIIASFAAREVFVSTMAIVYSVGDDAEEDATPLLEAMQKDTWPDGSPVFTPLSVLSLIVFFIFAMQCMATLAIVKRETNSWSWPLFQLGFMTATAYVASLLVFQIGSALGF